MRGRPMAVSPEGLGITNWTFYPPSTSCDGYACCHHHRTAWPINQRRTCKVCQNRVDLKQIGIETLQEVCRPWKELAPPRVDECIHWLLQKCWPWSRNAKEHDEGTKRSLANMHAISKNDCTLLDAFKVSLFFQLLWTDRSMESKNDRNDQTLCWS